MRSSVVVPLSLFLSLPTATTAFTPNAPWTSISAHGSTTTVSLYSTADQEEAEWEAMLERLQDGQYDEELADWCATQKRRVEFDMLASSRAERLKAVCDPWQTMYRQLQQFQREHGHCSVPKRYPPNQALADWVQQQHRSYRLDSLSSGQIQQLEQVGLQLVVDVEQRRVDILHVLEDKWEQKFQELVQFQQQHGHCNVPTKYDQALAEWVRYQRKWKTGLQQWQDKRERLEKIGFRW